MGTVISVPEFDSRVVSSASVPAAFVAHRWNTLPIAKPRKLRAYGLALYFS